MFKKVGKQQRANFSLIADAAAAAVVFLLLDDGPAVRLESRQIPSIGSLSGRYSITAHFASSVRKKIVHSGTLISYFLEITFSQALCTLHVIDDMECCC